MSATKTKPAPAEARKGTAAKRPTAKSKAPQTKARQSAAAPRRRPEAGRKPNRIDQLQQLLTRQNGASIDEMAEATGWQQHSVRGALAGALKKRGLAITSEKVDGMRRYRATAPA